MFNPYGFQGGTATLDPQAQGMNGQTRIAEAINGFAPNVTGTTPMPGYPVGQTNFVPGSIPNYGIPSYGIPNYGQPVFSNVPFGVSTNPFTNFVSPQTIYGIPQTFGAPVAHPFSSTVPCPTTPLNYGLPFNYGAPVNYPTPFGCPTTPFINQTPVHPWMQPSVNPFVNGPWQLPVGINPFATFNPYAIHPFAGFQSPMPFGGLHPVNSFHQPGINPLGGIPTIHPVTGQPMVSNTFSTIGGACNTPVSIFNNPMAQTPYGFHPMAFSPFVNPLSSIWNTVGHPMVNPWIQPTPHGFNNPMYQVPSHPFFFSPVTPTGTFNPLAANPLAVNPLGVAPVSNPLVANPLAGNPLVGNPLVAWGGSHPHGAGIDPVTYNYLCNLAGGINPAACTTPFGFGGLTTPFGNVHPQLTGRFGAGIPSWTPLNSINPFSGSSIHSSLSATHPMFGGIQNPWISNFQNPWVNPISSQWNQSFANPGFMNALCGYGVSNACTLPGVASPFAGVSGIGFGPMTNPTALQNPLSCWPANCN